MPVRRSTAADGPKQCWAVRPSLIHRRIATRRRTSSVTSTATVIVWPAVCIVDTCVHTVQVSTSRGAARAAHCIGVSKFSTVW
jgi:hypothetical protein